MKPKDIEPFIVDKRKEFIFALTKQGYNSRQIAYIFGMSRSNAHNIMSQMPFNYESPWKKQQENCVKH